MIKNRCSPVSLVLFIAVGAFLIGTAAAQAAVPSSYANGCVGDADNLSKPLNNPSCTANDVRLTAIVEGTLVTYGNCTVSLAQCTHDAQCPAGETCDGKGCTDTPGDTVTFSATGQFVAGQADRYDVGLFIETGIDSAGNGARFGSCTRFAFSSGQTGFSDPDDTDLCGDVEGSSTPTLAFGPVTIPCSDLKSPGATLDDPPLNTPDGLVDINHCETWGNGVAEVPTIHGTCNSAQDINSGTGSKCSCGLLAGACIAAADNNACTTDVCLGHCSVTTATTCADTTECPSGETCVDISLQHIDNSAACDDNDACTTDSCDATGGCVNTDNSARCNDNNACTADSCDSALGCVNTDNSARCDDNNACTTDSCASATGCVNTDNSARCNDNNACTTDSCDPASGCVNTDNSARCDDNNVCTTDSCVAATGCVNTDNSSRCDDNNACTTDSCNATGGCVNTDNSARCNDNNACTTDSCNSATGACSNADNSARCNDNNACTTDSCNPATGACSNADNSARCDDNNACTTDSCNPATGACSNTGTCGGGQIAPTATTCSDFAAGTGGNLTEILYGVKGTKINNVAPGVLFYYTHLNDVSSGDVIEVDQTHYLVTGSPLTPFFGVHAGQVKLYNADCSNASLITNLSLDGGGIVSFTIGDSIVGQDLILGIKYEPGTVVGTSVGNPPPTVHYDFSTEVNNVIVESDPDGLTLRKKP